MKITRYLMDGLTMSKDGETDKTAIVITLTEEEVYAAYREQQRMFRLGDAECQLIDYLKYDPNDADPHSMSPTAVEDFVLENGYHPSELFDKSALHYALDKIVDRFFKYHDCNIAENDLFQSICEEVVEELKEVKP